MKYCSTRGQEKNLTFEEVLFSGYAKDGGLYMPEFIPYLSHEEMEHWSKYSYPELVFAVARKFIDEEEIPSAVLNDIITSSLKRFRIPEVVKIEKLVGGLNVVELFHGTTLAFKDLALSVVGGLIDHYLSKRKKHITILIGTSGDTGSAAIEGVRGRKGIDIVVLLPSGRCTKIQELQMTTVIEDNVFVYKVEGTSDDLDEPIKKCFGDQELVSKHNLISINSINWGRIMAQVAHYFFTYYQLCSDVGAAVEIVVPTGAAGNITAGCIAKKMGLPITLVATVNDNDIISRTIDKGDFSMNSFVTQTMASAMDIQNPYNVERLIYLCCEGNVERIRKIMGAYESNGKVAIPEDILHALQEIVVGDVLHTLFVDDLFISFARARMATVEREAQLTINRIMRWVNVNGYSIVVNNSEITATMKKVYTENKYVVCPHTATAVYYHHQRNSNVPRGFIATASPAKFPEAVIEAGIDPITDGVDHLQYLPTKFLWMRKGRDLEDLVEIIELVRGRMRMNSP